MKDPDLYPIAIIEDRYNGAYSGGCWLAIAEARRPLDDTMSRASWCLHDGPHGDDITAMMFWDPAPDWIAAGATPEEAIEKLAQRRGQATNEIREPPSNTANDTSDINDLRAPAIIAQKE